MEISSATVADQPSQQVTKKKGNKDSAAALSQLPVGQLNKLDTAQLSKLNATALNKLNASQLSKLSATQLDKVSDAKLKTLPEATLSKLGADKLEALGLSKKPDTAEKVTLSEEARALSEMQKKPTSTTSSQPA